MDANPAADPFAVTSLDQLLALYDAPRELVLKKVTHRLEARTLAFIAASPFAILATSGPQGVHATPRGDDPGHREGGHQAHLQGPLAGGELGGVAAVEDAGDDGQGGGADHQPGGATSQPRA